MHTRFDRRILLLCLILGLGFALRFSQPTLVEFKRDEATIARLGQAIAFEGYLPAVGVDSSLGIDNLPLTLYLAALPLRLWSDPLAVVLFTILLNCLALPAGYFLARAALGNRIALVSTALFAVSSWAVLYARKIWSRTLPLFVIIFIASLLLTFVWRRRWALVIAFASLAALLGLQLEALAFIPMLAVAIVFYRDSVAWRPLMVGVLVFVLLLSPYIIHDARNGWENAQGLLAYAGGGGTFSWDAIRYAFALVGSQGIEGQTGTYYEQFRGQVPDLWWLNGALSVLLAGGLLYALHQAVRGKTQQRRRTFALLLLWFVVPLLSQVKPSAPTQPHYFVMHYPVQFMLIASFATAGLEWLGKRVGKGQRPSRWASYGLVGLLVLSCGWQVLVTGQLRVTMQVHPSTGGYGIPLRYTRQAAIAARELADGGEVIVLSEKTAPFVTETPTVFDALLFGVPHRFADPRAAIPFPEQEQFVYLAGPISGDGVSALEEGLEHLTALPSVSPGLAIRLSDGVTYRTYRWDAATRDEVIAGLVPLGTGVPFANNVVFAAYSTETPARAGLSAEVVLAWWARDLPPTGADYHFTAQVLSEAGVLMAQDDHAAFPSSSWRTGDLVLARFVIPLTEDLTPGTYRLRAGMYTYPDVAAVPVVNVAGEPVGDGVSLGELTIVE